jgi:ABC-2 type transport system permease protein
MSGYSNFQALKALVKASLQSISKSPSAIVFSIAFPLIFILVFGFLGGNNGAKISVGITPQTDTESSFYQSLRAIPGMQLTQITDTLAAAKSLTEGTLAAIIQIRQQPQGRPPLYRVDMSASTISAPKAAQLRQIMRDIAQKMDPEIEMRTENLIQIATEIKQARPFKTIDFILPGQLGFSLLSGSVFGTAFVFFNMRQTLVLKRFFATPVRREIIVLSEGIARMLFQLIGSVVIIAIGHYAFGYTLVHGLTTFIELLALSALAILVFMSIGFIISGIVKSDASIPMFANMIVMPQFLLAGTFFPIDSFPKWLQPISKAMPLTYLNDAMRQVAFDGAGLEAIKWNILILAAWGIVFYIVAGRVFKWE